MKNFEFYKNRHSGERCVIVCNGPSLNDMNLSFLKNEVVIGLNKIFLGFTKFNFYPRYYVAVNKKVIEQSISEIRSLTSVKFLSDRVRDVFVEDSLTNILKTEYYQDDFSLDISGGLQEGYTVTYAALQIAFYLGFQTVIIIGMDHRFKFEGAPNEEKFLTGKDVNHFAPSYFADKKWDNPDLVNSERYYNIAKKVFEEDGREIIDATINGACTVFPKAKYTELFRV